MTVDAIFAQALAKSTPAERTAYLDEACAHDLTLRQRVETLLQAHEAAGDFLGKPAIQCAAEALAGAARTEDMQAEAPGDNGDIETLDFLAPSDKPDSLGRLGHYEVLEVIGRGGMGIVLRAFDEKLHRVVAIKVMAAQLATNATARKRFTREAQAAAAVTHDHLVTIHAVEEANGLPYLVMQYVSGMSLQERLDRIGPLELREIVRIGMQTAAGLAAAHAHGLIHRDIKPANILLENGVERVKITDFGLARAVADASLTQSGVVAGTPQYMSPEQARGEAVDQRTDLFSLGSVLYAMCTGRPPFRADSGMAVLKRVCDDIPSAIRETNPEIPEWLVDIVKKLHAKNPADRFQSPAEVAELLKDHLAHLQHPSVVGPVAGKLTAPSGRPAGGELVVGQPAPRRRWATAAAVLLLGVVAGLGFTEATGVTSLRATVIRIFTPEGTLVVETDDPAVKVTVEGDGDLVITGAGPHEVRLKPGSYKLRATKDGKAVKLDRDLVTISRGDTQIVRVRLEGGAPAAAAAPKAGAGAFVLLGGKGVAKQKLDTLAEAVAAADHGDVIEIRGDGPFETDGVEVHGRNLVIRAAPGCRPVLSLSAKGRETDRTMFLGYSAALTLEGLTLQRIGSSPKGATALVYTEASQIRVANCRFVVKDNNAVALWGHLSPTMDVRNCEMVGSRVAVEWPSSKEGALSVENCLIVAPPNAYGVLLYHGQQVHKVDVRLTRNTFATHSAVGLDIRLAPDFLTSGSRPEAKRFRVEAEHNVFAVTGHTFSIIQDAEAWRDKPVPPGPFKKLVTDLVGWRDQRNLYSPEAAFMTTWWLPGGADSVELLVGFDQPAEWQQFAGREAGALRGAAHFAGGDLFTQAAATPERLLPKDFRLVPQSPGYQAGKDGQDLGADVDLVGPGLAYERWKKTPAYQEWLKDTKQVTSAEAAKPVLLMHFDEADFYKKDGKTYVRDRSGNGNDGLCEQVQFTPQGKTGGGLANAGKGFLRLPTSFIASRSNFTIAGWAKPTTLKHGYSFYTCLHTDYPARVEPNFNLFHNGNYLYAGAWNKSHDWIHVQSPEQNISPGEWTFIAASLENGEAGKGRLRLMLNDSICERPSQQVGGVPVEGINDIAALKLEGVLDELAVWDRALTEQELRELFARGQPNPKK